MPRTIHTTSTTHNVFLRKSVVFLSILCLFSHLFIFFISCNIGQNKPLMEHYIKHDKHYFVPSSNFVSEFTMIYTNDTVATYHLNKIIFLRGDLPFFFLSFVFQRQYFIYIPIIIAELLPWHRLFSTTFIFYL